MRVTVRDPQVLGAIRISSILSYLRSRGWVLSEEHESFSIWTTPVQNGATSVEILLPASAGLQDFPRRMADIIQVISAIEDRSELEVIADLSLGSADVVRIAVKDASTDEGTIGLNRGLALVDGARNMMVAAACSALQPRAVYGTRKLDRAFEMADGLLLGQTERGGYVLTVCSRGAPLRL